MRYGQLRKYDVANGTGIRVTAFVTGCSHKCEGCFNKEYQDHSAGTLWTPDTSKQLIEWLQLPEIAGLSLLGGEPFDNATGLTEVLQEVRDAVKKDVWVWSGYTLGEILRDSEKARLLDYCDVLVDGRFVEAKKDLTLKFRGSSNQRLINVKESLKKGVAIELDV